MLGCNALGSTFFALMVRKWTQLVRFHLLKLGQFAIKSALTDTQ